MIKLLFFDTETTGLPTNLQSHFSEIDNWPRLVQLAFLLFDESGNLISTGDYIVKPFGYHIPPGMSKIHGISNAQALTEGLSAHLVLSHFLCHLAQADYLIAHNFSFDMGVVGSEVTRLGLEKQFTAFFDTRQTICTMHTTTHHCAIKKGRGYKRPCLHELHKHLFNTSFDNAHNAMADVQATAKCFFELKRLGFYKILHDQSINLILLATYISSTLFDLEELFDFV